MAISGDVAFSDRGDAKIIIKWPEPGGFAYVLVEIENRAFPRPPCEPLGDPEGAGRALEPPIYLKKSNL